MILLFDADNTLYNTSEVAPIADRRAMKYFAEQCDESPTVLYKEWRIIVKKLMKSPNPKKRTRQYSYGELGKKYGFKNIKEGYELFEDSLVKHLRLERGVEAALALPYQKAIVSEDDKKKLERKLVALGIRDCFELVISSQTLGVMKPHRKFYEVVFKKFNVTPSECVVIGDDFHKDLEIPKRLGCRVLHYKKDFKDFFELPHLLK